MHWHQPAVRGGWRDIAFEINSLADPQRGGRAEGDEMPAGTAEFRAGMSGEHAGIPSRPAARLTPHRSS
jgi:hypothetical protein